MQVCLFILLILAAISHAKSVMLFLTIFWTYVLDIHFEFQILLIYVSVFLSRKTNNIPENDPQLQITWLKTRILPEE